MLFVSVCEVLGCSHFNDKLGVQKGSVNSMLTIV